MPYHTFPNDDHWTSGKIITIGAVFLGLALIAIFIASEVITSGSSSFGPPAHSADHH